MYFAALSAITWEKKDLYVRMQKSWNQWYRACMCTWITAIKTTDNFATRHATARESLLRTSSFSYQFSWNWSLRIKICMDTCNDVSVMKTPPTFSASAASIFRPSVSIQVGTTVRMLTFCCTVGNTNLGKHSAKRSILNNLKLDLEAHINWFHALDAG